MLAKVGMTAFQKSFYTTDKHCLCIYYPPEVSITGIVQYTPNEG